MSQYVLYHCPLVILIPRSYHIILNRYHWHYHFKKIKPYDLQPTLSHISTLSMVFILDGCSFHVAQTRSFFEKKIDINDSFDVTKCLEQIEKPDLLHVCAWWNEQPSIIKTMHALCRCSTDLQKYMKRLVYLIEILSMYLPWALQKKMSIWCITCWCLVWYDPTQHQQYVFKSS